MEITINEKNYKLKYTLRALFIFEQITGKLFKLETLTDEYIFYYSIIAANNPDLDLTFEDYINAMDEEPELIQLFQVFIKKELDKQKMYIKANDDGKKKF